MAPFTHCELSDVTPLCMPWMQANGQAVPAFSAAAAALSLELAASAYRMDMSAWRAGGWTDISYLTDNTLLTGPSANGGTGGGLSALMSGYYQRMARSRIRRINPVTQVLGTLRQREGSDTCKAVTMIHPAPGGRYVVAVGFMGTGKRVFDWISNFRLAHEDGMHLGFLQLTKEFERNCDKILFPETARALGLEQLTLQDILLECRRADSRFHLWMAGHSQGGAVMQLFAWRESRRGMLRQHMTGYGFASPSVLYENPGCDLAALPLFHLINADDMIPRVGALLHVGRCRIFPPDERMRAVCYAPFWADPAFRAVLGLLYLNRDSGAALLFIQALLEAVQKLPGEESARVLKPLLGRFLPERLLSALDGHIDAGIRHLIRRVQQGYALSTGHGAPPETLLAPMRIRIEEMMARFGSRSFSIALGRALMLPHRLVSADPAGEASYQYIVNRCTGALRQQIWYGPAITGAAARRPARRVSGLRSRRAVSGRRRRLGRR